MEIGQKIQINNIVYTIWLIEQDVIHIIDDEGNGLCLDKEYLKSIIN